MTHHGVIGTLTKTWREAGIDSFEWEIPGFLSLAAEVGDFYSSHFFDACDGRWKLRIFPNGMGHLTSGYCDILLVRASFGFKARSVTVGIRGVEGVRNRRKLLQEILPGKRYYWLEFCWRDDLIRDGMLNGGALIITLEVAPYKPRDSSTQTLEADTEAPIEEVESSEKKDVSTQTLEDAREAPIGEFQFSGQKAACDDDVGDESSSDKNGAESKVEKNVLQLRGVKKTKKISLPTQHGGVISSLKSILKGKTRADFTLKSGSAKWPVHRAILESRSGHFEDLFQREQKNEVRLFDVAEGVLEVVLHFLYAGEAEDLTTENVRAVYAMASKLNLGDLESLCIECMKEWMCPELVCIALIIAERCGEGDLRERALQCYFREPARVVDTEGWKELRENDSDIIAELFQEFIIRKGKNRMKEQE